MLNEFLKEKAKQDQNKQDQKKQDSTKNDAGNDGDAEKDGDDAGNDGDAEKDGTDGDAEKDGTDGKDGRKSKENAQNSKKPSNNQTTPADQDSSNFGDIDLDAAIEMLQNLLEEIQQNPNQSKQDSELSDFQKKMLSNAMRTNPKTQATLEKMAILQNLDKNDMISDLPEAFKKLLWSVPKMLGVFKDVIDGFKRGRPSATFGEKILQTRGKLVRPRTSKIAQDFDLYPSLALLDIAKNNTHVYRAEQTSGEGEFVLAVDLSGSMMNYFDQQYSFSFFDLAKTIAMCLYSVKKTNIVGWGDQSIIFPSQQHFAMASAHQSDTLIRTCYHAIAQLFETKRIAHKLQKGTDVVILTDGLPKEKESNMGEAIKTLVTQNKGVVWLFDLVGERNDRDEQIPEGWAAMADHYVRIKTLDDVKNIESVMRKSLRKK